MKYLTFENIMLVALLSLVIFILSMGAKSNIDFAEKNKSKPDDSISVILKESHEGIEFVVFVAPDGKKYLLVNNNYHGVYFSELKSEIVEAQ